jgi:pectinesterase
MRYLEGLTLLLLFSVIAAAKEPITVYLAGDSTMAEKLAEKRPETGWGELLQERFKEGKVRVENHAKNGRSTRTFIEEKLWQAIIDKLKKGDYVFIQFGHNDQSKEKVDRYASPEAYRANLVRFVRDVREMEAIPVLLTPVMRRRFTEQGEFYDSHGEYPDIVRAVAAEYRVPLIDLHRKSEQVIRQYGAEGSKQLFLWLKPDENLNYPGGVQDNTHFSPRGAEVVAALVVEGIREQKLGLAGYLKKSGKKSSHSGSGYRRQMGGNWP